MTQQNSSSTTASLPLDELIRLGRGGKISQREFAQSFASTRVLLLCANEATEESVEPLILTLPSGEPGVALFAGPDFVDDEYLDAAPHPVPLSGGELLGFIPAELGMALNPGHPDSLVIEPGEMPSFVFVALAPEE